MAQATVIRINGALYRLVATIDEGRSLYFAAGQSIAVEKFDMRPGGTEFDFQVNSRAMKTAQPEAVMATKASMDGEFIEARTKMNLFGLPLSYGNLNVMRRERRIALSYGELKPQIFISRAKSDRVAWRIWFKGSHYSGNPSVPGLPKSTVPARGIGSANARAGSAAPGAGGVDGAIGPLTNQAGVLRIYVRADDEYQPFGRPFDRGDVIFRPFTLMERMSNFVRGRGR